MNMHDFAKRELDRLCPPDENGRKDNGAFVWYTCGDTAAKTPYDCMHPIQNAYVIGETGLGGCMT